MLPLFDRSERGATRDERFFGLFAVVALPGAVGRLVPLAFGGERLVINASGLVRWTVPWRRAQVFLLDELPGARRSPDQGRAIQSRGPSAISTCVSRKRSPSRV